MGSRLTETNLEPLASCGVWHALQQTGTGGGSGGIAGVSVKL